MRLSNTATPAHAKSNDLLLHLLLTLRMQEQHMQQQHKLHPDEVGLWILRRRTANAGLLTLGRSILEKRAGDRASQQRHA